MKAKEKSWKAIPVAELWDVGVASFQGNRPTMEDTHIVKSSAQGEFIIPNLLAGICDGHGGVGCAKFVVEEIPKSFFEELGISFMENKQKEKNRKKSKEGETKRKKKVKVPQKEKEEKS